ncbi:hypothetical protein XELAEV_18012566mg [Xenopus laevis]|uniref:Uncharacterized protein n=1 Tax=Xenopus laevis TaxID=8355 RepID=A0A974DMU4_XENLA|nr:hypothetical protein XELAEV_18012566mg [Xenopus laevis]
MITEGEAPSATGFPLIPDLHIAAVTEGHCTLANREYHICPWTVLYDHATAIAVLPHPYSLGHSPIHTFAPRGLRTPLLCIDPL